MKNRSAVCARRDPRRGGIVGAILISAAAVCVLIAIAGIQVARNVRVREAGHNDVFVETPVGDFSIHGRHLDAATDPDVPPYPGAVRRKPGGAATFEWDPKDGDRRALTVAGDEMVTQDSPEKVIDFYRDQDPNWIVAQRSNREIHLELRDGGYRRFVVIHAKADGTHIGVASIGAPAAN